MKVVTSKFAIVVAIISLMAVVGVSPVLAQVPNFPSGFSQSQLCPGTGCSITVNGGTLDDLGPGVINPAGWTPNVPQSTTVLRLTDDAINQRGSAWFDTAQPVTQAWSSTFQFRLTSDTSRGDGFAFVIQNSGLSAIGGFGGGIGYGTRFTEDPPCSTSDITCTAAGSDVGISNSVAIEFDTFLNTYDPDNQHIAVQGCGSSPNSPDHNDINCSFKVASTSVNMADGGVHTARIEYTPFNCFEGPCPSNLFVYLDGATEATLAASVNLGLALNLGDGNTALVGFTAATRGAHEAHEILSWTFTQSQTQQVSANQTTTFQFGVYNFTVTPSDGSPINVTVAPILKSQADCNDLVKPTFPGAKCFVYDNADGMGGQSAVMFEVTCPDSSTNECGGGTDPAFNAELGSNYPFTKAFNPLYRGMSGTGNPLPGWLKGQPTDNIHPCNPNPGNSPALFQSNQIESFVVVGDPIATTKGKSGGTGSCWVATYNTPGVLPSVSVTTPANNANYPQGANIPSAFTCTPVNTLVANPTSAVGPYLTVPTTPAPGCTASVDGGAPITSGTPISTTPGPHTFVATVLDSGSDTVSTQTINYNVVGPTDVAILKVGPLFAPIKSKVTYVIGVGDIGSQPAVDVNVSDVLPANTTLVSGSVSANKVSCSIVSKKLVCTTTPVSCSTTSTSVSCSVGTLQPLSLSSLNGATIKLTVQLGTALTTGKVVKNTATVSATNTDTHTGNNSSTASTLLTAH